jgi:putative tryptophan/tyrosine transport system substrate-binding protein
MRRREFIAALSGAAAWPMVARAQQPDKRPTIGFPGTTTPSTMSQWINAFTQRLLELARGNGMVWLSTVSWLLS